MDERRPGGMGADGRDAADRRAGGRNSGEKVCIKAPYIDQSGAYPTGCESVSAVMLLRFLGVGISVDEFIEKYLDKQGFEERDGVLYGPDPRKYFCGSPYDADSFGCYAPVVAKALRRALGSGYTVTDETGVRLEELARRYLGPGDAGRLLGVHQYAGASRRPAVETPGYGRDVYVDLQRALYAPRRI